MAILKENDNLDLDTYKQYMHEFYKFSGDLFEFDHTIFQSKVRDPQEILDNKLRRSSLNEYELTEKQLARKTLNTFSSAVIVINFSHTLLGVSIIIERSMSEGVDIALMKLKRLTES